jgi:hypothetical protein
LESFLCEVSNFRPVINRNFQEFGGLLLDENSNRCFLMNTPHFPFKKPADKL